MRKHAHRVARGRRGVATVIVMLLVAVALAVAYVSMRSQTMTLQMHSHASLRASAHETAMTGMAIALQKMQTPDWCNGAGVSTVLSQSLGGGRRFQATYATGDESLTASDPAYAEYPYRVTVSVTGYAADPANASQEISHRLRAVVRLVPRALATEPTGWNDITGNTFCQWAEGYFHITAPFRIEGPVRVRAAMDLSADYLGWTSTHRGAYFSGLNALRSGAPDCRPFNANGVSSGYVKLPYLAQTYGTCDLLNTNLGVATQDASMTTSISWPSGTLPSGYRLYPGGKLYTAPTLPAELRNTTLGPDPRTNPIGAFIRAGMVRVYENVTLHGTIFLSGIGGSLETYGTNIQLRAVDLPALTDMSGSPAVPVRLPTVFAQDDISLFSGSQAQITGLLIAADRLTVDGAAQNSMSLTLQGKMAVRNVFVFPRTEWNQSSLWWGTIYGYWYAQRYNLNGIRYFPTYVQYYGLNMQPLMTIKPDEGNILYHWQNPTDPLYAPHPSDVTTLDPTHPSLRWELLNWIDNPAN